MILDDPRTGDDVRSSDRAVVRRRARLSVLLLSSPIALWLFVFVVAPNLLLFAYSFFGRDEFGRIVATPSLSNWRRLFGSVWLKILGVSAGYAALTTIYTLVIGWPVAWTIANAPPRRRSTLIVAVMIPFWTSFLVRAYGWIAILKEDGIVAATLRSVGATNGRMSILYTPTAVLIGLLHVYLPFMILPIFGSAEKLDRNLIEAARDLGATRFDVFRRVVWPLTLPGVKTGALLVFLPSLSMFAVADLLGGGRFPMLGNVIQNQFGPARDWPFGAALGSLVSVLFFAAFFLGSRRRRSAA